MSYRRVSLLVPTRKRPGYLRAFLDSYYATASGHDDSEIVFRIDYDDLESLEVLAEHHWLVIVGPRRRGYQSLPGFYNEMARLATGDILICCNDDVVIETPGWAQLVIEAANRFPDGIFDIGVSTIFTEDNYVFSCVSRKLVNRLGFINDERLVYSDIFLMDVAKHFGRLEKLWSVTFRHNWAGEYPETADLTRREGRQIETEQVFASGSEKWSDKYRALHDRVVAEAVARIDPEGEFVAGQALISFEEYRPPIPLPRGYWPPRTAAEPWSAPRDADAGIHYHRGEMFELFKTIALHRLPRRRAVLSWRGNGLAGVLWGQLYDQVVIIDEAKEPGPVIDGKYRVEFGAIYNAPFMYGLIERAGAIDAAVLDGANYAQLISPYFTLRRAMARPSLIVVIGTKIGASSASHNHARRFVDDLMSSRVDGVTHDFIDISLPGGNGVSYELLE